MYVRMKFKMNGSVIQKNVILITSGEVGDQVHVLRKCVINIDMHNFDSWRYNIRKETVKHFSSLVVNLPVANGLGIV